MIYSVTFTCLPLLCSAAAPCVCDDSRGVTHIDPDQYIVKWSTIKWKYLYISASLRRTFFILKFPWHVCVTFSVGNGQQPIKRQWRYLLAAPHDHRPLHYIKWKFTVLQNKVWFLRSWHVCESCVVHSEWTRDPILDCNPQLGITDLKNRSLAYFFLMVCAVFIENRQWQWYFDIIYWHHIDIIPPFTTVSMSRSLTDMKK